MVVIQMAVAKYKKNNRGYYEAKIWDGTYNTDGSKHRLSIRSKLSSADLERKVNDFKNNLSNDEPVAVITLGEYADKWFSLYAQNKEMNTRKMYMATIKYLYPISDVRLPDLRHSHLQQIVNLNAEHPKTCKNIKVLYTQLIKSAIRDRYLPHRALEELTADISMPKYQKPLKRALSESEIKAMHDADLSPMKRTYVTLLYYTGIRRGEALALTPNDFDFDNRTLTISKTIIFDGNNPILKPYPKSDNGMRVIPLSEPCISILKKYVSDCEGYLFKGQNRPLMTESAYKRMWQSIVTSMNVALGYNPNAKKDKSEKPITKLTAHRFRHNFCTQLCYQIPSISTKMIARLMGDTEKVVLEVYSHILEEKEDVRGAMERAFSD